MTQRDCAEIQAGVILFDERSRVGALAARQSLRKVWLSMYLGSAGSLSIILAAKHIF